MIQFLTNRFRLKIIMLCTHGITKDFKSMGNAFQSKKRLLVHKRVPDDETRNRTLTFISDKTENEYSECLELLELDLLSAKVYLKTKPYGYVNKVKHDGIQLLTYASLLDDQHKVNLLLSLGANTEEVIFRVGPIVIGFK